MGTKLSGLKFSNEGIILLVLAGILIIGISVGVIRHARRGKMELETVVQAPLRIKLNQASVDDLSRLPGIGVELAERIVVYREEHGYFLHVDSLLNVPGIGQVKLAEIKPYLEVDSCLE